jgi:Mn-containing catalase
MHLSRERQSTRGGSRSVDRHRGRRRVALLNSQGIRDGGLFEGYGELDVDLRSNMRRKRGRRSCTTALEFTDDPGSIDTLQF